jgi:DNA invertase Pin-like site-specific DNA recombinase
MAQALYPDGSHSIEDICRTLGISRATLYRVITPREREQHVGWTHGLALDSLRVVLAWDLLYLYVYSDEHATPP